MSENVESPQRLLGYTNLTDWFIHEGRNAFATTTVDLGIEWTQKDYNSGKKQLRRVLDAFKRFDEDGVLPREEMKDFIRKSVSNKWSADTVGAMHEEFQSMVQRAMKD